MAETLVLDRPKRKNPPRYMTLENYFRAEESAIDKHEYHNGIVIKMAGGTYNHDKLSVRTTTILDNFVEENELSFSVNGSNLKIRIDDYDKVVYPDALVITDTPQFYLGRKDTIINPLLIIEVLSDSTKDYDRTTKFEMYRTLPSFKEYVLIHQDRKRVSVWTKQVSSQWFLQDYEGDDAVAILYHVNECPFSLKKLYSNIII